MSADERASFAINVDSRGAVKGGKQAEKALDGIEKESKQTEDAFGDLKSTALKLFAVLGGFLALKDAIRVMASFEDTMGQLKGVTDATNGEMRQLEETARSLGATTRFTAAQAGEGLLLLSRAGFSVAESQEAVGATLDLATAAVIELGRASEITGSTIRQFGLDADESRRVVDVLVKAANSASTTVESVAQGMSFAGAVAKSMGEDLETTAALLGVLADRSIKGTRGGMALRQILLSLADPTAKAKKQLKELGLTLDEVNPVKVGTVGAFEALNRVNLNVIQSARIFEKRQAAAGVILAENVGRAKEQTAAYKAMTGEARKNAKILEETLTGRYKELISTLDEVKLKLGDAGFSGALRASLRFITAVTRELFNIKTGAEKSSLAVRATAMAVKWLTIAVAAMIALSWPLMMLALHKSFVMVIPKIKAFTVMVWAANKALLATAMSITKILLPAIAAVGVAFIAFEFGRWISGMKEIQLVSNDAVRGIAKSWEWLKKRLKMTWAVVSDFAITWLVNPIITAFHEMKTEILSIINSMAIKVKKVTRALGLDELSSQLAAVVSATKATGARAPTVESDLGANLTQIKKDYEAAITIIDNAHKMVKDKIKRELAERPTVGFFTFMKADLIKLVDAMGLFKGESSEAEKVLAEMEKELAEMRKNAEGIKPIEVEPIAKATGELTRLREEGEKAVVTGQDFADTLASGFASATKEMKNFGQAIAGIIVQLQDMLMQKGFQALFNNLFNVGGLPSPVGATMEQQGQIFAGLGDQGGYTFVSPTAGADIGFKSGGKEPAKGGGDTYFQLFSHDAQGINNMLIKDDKVTHQMSVNARAGYSISNPEVI